MKRRMQLLLLSGMLICSPATVALASEQTLEYIDAETVSQEIRGILETEEIAAEKADAETADAETAAGDVAIDETNFPDANFRKYVLENCDTDKDGGVSKTEIESCVEIDVSAESITSMKGIEFFTELLFLDCCYNQLTKLDVSNSPNLEYFYCAGNQLTTLDVSKNPKLTYLNCADNQLTELDVSNNNRLEYLYCSGNQLTELDVSNNNWLKDLLCNNNQLTKLDLSNNFNLWVLECKNNQLTELDVSNNDMLQDLYCSNNQLAELNVINNNILEELDCSDNQLTELDVSNNEVLRWLKCSGNQLTELNVNKCTKLTWLVIDEKVLETVDFNSNWYKFHIMLVSNSLDMSRWKGFDSSKISEMYGIAVDDDIFTVTGSVTIPDSTRIVGRFKYGQTEVELIPPMSDEPEEPANPDIPFEDLNVPEDNWKYQAVKYVYEKGIMTGMGSDKIFAPDNTLTRAMFATILYRMAGEPAVEFDADRFTDVEGGRWYSNAIIWANDNQIVNGFADGSYGVEADITREQIAKMLYQYAVICGYDTTASKELDEFTDSQEVSDWAVDYIKWAAGSNMISGKPNEDGGFRIDPQGKATRAECAKMIQKFEQGIRE